jgi:transcriptional regulator with XRE-family HTH domain
MSDRPTKFSDQLRQAIDGCGLTRYAIAKATGIAESTLSRFMSGERGLPMKTLDRLAECLGLEIVLRPKRKKGKPDGKHLA